MADDKPKIQIDTDWKRQAQEEKRRLAEQEAQRAAQATTAAPSAGGHSPPAADSGAASVAGRQPASHLPIASFAGMVRSMAAQVLMFLGEMSTRGTQPMVDLDMAKYQIDTLGILEEKTRGNLDEAEQRALDTALYEVRMRYVAVAQQYIG